MTLASLGQDVLLDVLGAIDTGLIALDAERRVRLWNAWMEDASGISAADAMGCSLVDIFPSVGGGRLPPVIDDAFSAGTTSLLTHALNPGLLPLRTHDRRPMAHNIIVRSLASSGEIVCVLQVIDISASLERERVLRERQNARYRAVVDTAIDAIITTGLDGSIQWTNAAAERQFGFGHGEMIGRPIGSVLDHRDAWPAAAISDDKAIAIEVWGRRQDGTALPLEMSATSWTSDGRTFVTGILRDITDRKRAEDALRAAAAVSSAVSGSELLHELVRELAQGLGMRHAYVAEFVGDQRDQVRTRAVWSNGAVGEPYQYAIQGTPCEDVISSSVIAIGSRVRRRYPEAPILTAMDAESFVGVCMSDSAGRPIGVVAAIDTNPITDLGTAEKLVSTFAARVAGELERQRTELALRQLNDTLEQRVTERTEERDRMWRLSQDLFLIIAPDGTIRAINPAVTSLLGHEVDDMVGRHLGPFVHPEDVAATANAIQRGAEAPFSDLETRLRAADGTWRWFAWSAVPGEGIVYAVGRDITAEKERQDELVQAQEALRQSQKLESMGQLTGGVAHDFNNLLTPIIASLDILQRRGVGDERTQKLVDGALQSAERAKTLVQRLLAFARRQPLQPTAVDLPKLIEGMADLVDSTSGPRVKVAVDIAANLPPVRADQNQLEMAILNLSVNARDAMPDGGLLTIAVAAERVASGHRSKLVPGRYVRLSVADTGTGMDETTLKRAIEPFFSTKGIGKGTGLGLSMVHGLAAQLGGGLTIQSRAGLGTSVEIWLPIAQDEQTARSEVLMGRAALPATETVLLVDDEDLVRASTSHMLGELGYAVTEASSAEAALRLIDGGLVPDIVITDHLMPGMTGVDLIRELATRPLAPRVLVVSGYAEDTGLAPDLPRLTKPFRQDELVAALAELTPPADSARGPSRLDAS